MATQIDENIVRVRFDNDRFEQNMNATISSLDKFQKKTDEFPKKTSKTLQPLIGMFDNVKKTFINFTSEINKSSEKADMSTIQKSLDTINQKFSVVERVAVNVLSNIATKALSVSTTVTNAFTLEPINAGLQEYEAKMTSIQTIMASTKEPLSVVKKHLSDLNEYSDKTIYSFSDMTSNIGKFTNSGVKLDKAVTAIKGVSNLAAISGAGAGEASRAMYNISQALSTGHTKLIDWKSIELANMATKDFKENLIKTALSLNVIKKKGDEYVTSTGEMFSATRNFNDSLKEEWLTSEVMIKTLSNYADETTEIGKKATLAATEVRTMSSLISTVKETLQSGWAESFEYIFGDFYEAKDLFTSINKVISEYIDISTKNRNNLLKEIVEFGGRTALFNSFSNIFRNLVEVIGAVKKGITDAFPPATGKQISEFLKNVENFTNKIRLSSSQLSIVTGLVGGIGKTFKFVYQIISAVISSVFKIIHGLTSGLKPVELTINNLLDMYGKLIDKMTRDNFVAKLINDAGNTLSRVGNMIGSFIGNIFDSANRTNIIANIFDVLYKGATRLNDIVTDVVNSGSLKSLFDIYKLLMMNNIFTHMKKFIDDLGVGSNGIGQILEALGDSLQAFQGKIKSETIKNIAKAILILAVGLYIIAKIDTDKIVVASIAINILLASLNSIATGFNKINKQIDTKSMIKTYASMYLLGIVVGQLASIMIKFKDVSVQQMGVGLIGTISVLILALGMLKALPDTKKQNVKLKGAFVVILMVKSMSKDLINLSKLKVEDLGKGILGLAAILVMFLYTLNNIPKIEKQSIISIIGFIIFIKSIIKQLNVLKNINIQDFGRSMLYMIAVLTSAIVTLNNIPKVKKVSIVSIFGLLALIKGMVENIVKIKDVPFSAVASVSLMLIAILGTLKLLEAVKMDWSTASNITGFIWGLNALIDAFNKLKDFKPEFIVAGLVSLAGMLGGMYVILKGFNKISAISDKVITSLYKMAAAISVLGLAILVLGIGIARFNTAFARVSANMSINAVVIASAVAGIIKGFLQGLIDSGEQIKQLIKTFATIITESTPIIVESFINMFVKSLEAFSQEIPYVGKLLGDILVNLFDSMEREIPRIVVSLKKLINTIKNILIDNLGTDYVLDLEKVISTFGLLLLLFTQVAKFSPAMYKKAQVGLVLMVPLILTLVGILVLLGWINKIKGLSDLIKNGKSIFNAIGTVIGAFISGIFGRLKFSLDPKKTSEILKTITSVMTPLSGVLWILSKTKIKKKDLITNIAGLTALVIPLVLFSTALSYLKDPNVKPEGIYIISGVIAAMSGILWFLSKIKMDTKTAITNILALSSMVIPLVLFGLAVNLLKDITVKKETMGDLLYTILYTSIILGVLTKINVNSKNLKDVGAGILALTAMIIPLITFGLALALLKDITINKTVLEGLLVTIGAMALLLIPLMIMGTILSAGMGVNALGTAVALGLLTAMVAPLLAFGSAINLLKDVQVNKAALESILMTLGLMTLLLIPLTLIGTLFAATLGLNAIGTIVAIGLLTAMVIPLKVFGDALNSMKDLQVNEETIDIIVQTLYSMVGILTALGVISPLLIGIAIALGAFALVTPLLIGALVQVGIISVAIGGLTSVFPSLKDFAASGIDILIKVAEGVGLIISAFMTGISAGAMKVIENIGVTLERFSSHIPAFSNNIKSFDDTAVHATTNFAKAVGMLILAGFINNVTSLLGLGSGFESLGKRLSMFSEEIKPFFDNIKDLKLESVLGIKVLAEAIQALTVASFIDGIGKLIGLGTNIDNMINVVESLGKAVKVFTNEIKGISEADINKTNIAADIIKKIGETYSSLPKEGGIFEVFTGKSIFNNLHTGIGNLSNAIKEMITKIDDKVVNQHNVDRIKMMFSLIKEIGDTANSLPKENGIWQSIVGHQKSITEFSNSLQDVVGTLSTLLGSVEGNKSINQDNVDRIKNALTLISELGKINKEIQDDKQSSFFGWGKDDKLKVDIGNFTKTLKTIMGKIKEVTDMVTAKNSSLKDDVINTTKNAVSVVMSLAEITNKLTEDPKRFKNMSKIDWGNWSSGFKTLGTNLSGLFNAIGTISQEKLPVFDTMKNMLNTLIEMGKSTSKESSENIQNMAKAIEHISAIFASISNKLSEIDGEAIEQGKQKLTKLKEIIEMFATIPEGNPEKTTDNTKALEETSDSFKSFVDGMDEIDQGLIESAKNRISGFIEMITNITSIDTTNMNALSESLSTLSEKGIKGFYETFTNENIKANINEAINSLINHVKDHINSKEQELADNNKSLVDRLSNNMVPESARSGTINSGSYFIDGFVIGIQNNAWKVKDAVHKVATQAATQLRVTLDINSPSRVTEESGTWFGQGFINGILGMIRSVRKASKQMGESSYDTLQDSIKRHNKFDLDFDMNPTIKPVMDLSNVTANSKKIQSMLDDYNLYVNGRVATVSNNIVKRNQNGTNNDVIAAVNGLKSEITNMNNNTYNINGITYDDGHNISTAVQTLVRAARIERRR